MTRSVAKFDRPEVTCVDQLDACQFWLNLSEYLRKAGWAILGRAIRAMNGGVGDGR